MGSRLREWSLLLPDDEQTGSYSGTEVGFEEIAIDLLEARFSVLNQ